MIKPVNVRGQRTSAVILAMSLPDHLPVLRMPGAPGRSAPQGRSPVRVRPGAAERSEAALIYIWAGSAVGSYGRSYGRRTVVRRDVP